MGTYRQIYEGDWEPVGKGYKHACCGCGLVHIRKFRVRKGKVEEQHIVDRRSTAALRRHKKIEKGQGWIKIKTES